MSAEQVGILVGVIAILARVVEMVIGKMLGNRSSDRPAVLKMAEHQAATAHALRDVALTVKELSALQRDGSEIIERMGGPSSKGRVRMKTGGYPTSAYRSDSEDGDE